MFGSISQQRKNKLAIERSKFAFVCKQQTKEQAIENVFAIFLFARGDRQIAEIASADECDSVSLNNHPS